MSGLDATTTSTPTTCITNAVSKVVTLPELIEYIGRYLQPSDLFSCIQVNRFWNQTLIPLLWHTINTITKSWLRTINDNSPEKRSRGEIEEWIQKVIAKHGRHIQDLTVHWSPVLEAISFNRECRNLRSLAVVKWRSSDFFPPNEVLERITAATTQLPWGEGNGGYFYGNAAQRYFLERIWTLLRQSPYLARLSFPYLDSMHDLPQEFIIDSLMSLHHLRDLDKEWLPLDTGIMLRSLPKLKRVHVDHLRDLLSLPPEERFRGLRMLRVQTAPVSYVLKVLEHLPGLEELRLYAFSSGLVVLMQEGFDAAVRTRVRDMPALKTLQYDKMPSQWDDMSMAELVRQLPRLSRIKVPMLLRATEQALWEKCYFLEEIDSLNGGSKICKWRVRREVGEEDEDEDSALEAELA